MVPESENMQRPRVTEINIRIDCNGCVQKIKKAINGIQGIYNYYIDIPQQKLIITGWADPERIIKAIKKVRKIATICSHTDAPDPNCQPTQPQPDGYYGGAPPPPDSGYAQPGEPQNSEPMGPPPQEQPNYQPPQEQPYYQPPPQEQPNYQPQEQPNYQPPPQEQPNYQPQEQPNYQPPPQEQPNTQPSELANEHSYKEEVHIINHHPTNCGNGYGYSNGYGHQYSHPGPSYRYEPPPQPGYQEPPPQQPYHEPPPPPQPDYATHSYNRYMPSPNITGYQSVQSLPPYRTNDRADNYYMHSYQNGTTNNENVTSMFSDDNPNACTIV